MKDSKEGLSGHMSKEDEIRLDRILTTYSNREVAAVIAQLCHGHGNVETKRIIEYLQEEVSKREN